MAGCSEEYGYNSEVAATESATPAPTIIDEDAAETVPSSGEELHMLTAQQGIAMTVGGETANGCYSLDPYPDASADIASGYLLTQIWGMILQVPPTSHPLRVAQGALL